MGFDLDLIGFDWPPFPTVADREARGIRDGSGLLGLIGPIQRGFDRQIDWLWRGFDRLPFVRRRGFYRIRLWLRAGLLRIAAAIR